uniref:Uncharacterized protein n=1 Tax=Candidatus Kentrum sp. TC TaxID=2126339 RepID=A0A450Z5R7_9GAMM|nr:MAG: hypothetical protein BECKTC1821D_GA0114238_10698 [Candidatus Kentron sp. TC]VFK56805.1 MAG: hypothetical protein BECKTC1821F_GA0114240_101248 [Candidatus Kentron sp. TC]
MTAETYGVKKSCTKYLRRIKVVAENTSSKLGRIIFVATAHLFDRAMGS